MSIDTDALRALPTAEKLRLVEFLWDDLGDATAPIPLPDWVDQETARRRAQMRDPSFGLSHEETWERVGQRPEK